MAVSRPDEPEEEGPLEPPTNIIVERIKEDDEGAPSDASEYEYFD